MTEPTREGVASIHDVRPAYASALMSSWTVSVDDPGRHVTTTCPAPCSRRSTTVRPRRCQRARGRVASDRYRHQ